MPDSQDRKPQPTPQREPAQVLLNRFLEENGMLIGTDKPDIDLTPKGQIIIGTQRVIAVYRDEVGAPSEPAKN